MLKDILLSEFNCRGFCPEMESCNYDKTEKFNFNRKKYIEL